MVPRYRAFANAAFRQTVSASPWCLLPREHDGAGLRLQLARHVVEVLESRRAPYAALRHNSSRPASPSSAANARMLPFASQPSAATAAPLFLRTRISAP